MKKTTMKRSHEGTGSQVSALSIAGLIAGGTAISNVTNKVTDKATALAGRAYDAGKDWLMK